MKRGLSAPISFVMFTGTVIWSMRRTGQRQDATFCAILYECWDNPHRDKIDPWKNPRIHAYEEYLEAGFWYQVCNEPPHDALAMFEGVDSIEYSKTCLSKAQAEVDELMVMKSQINPRKHDDKIDAESPFDHMDVYANAVSRMEAQLELEKQARLKK